MRVGMRRFVLACVVAASALAVLVPAGSAGPRAMSFSFVAEPGPGQVTYGQNIAYRAQISNTSGTTLTHVIFRMRKPFVGPPESPVLEAQFKNSTCPQNGGQGVTVTYADGTSEWTCDFGNLPAWSGSGPQVTLSVVWGVPASTATTDCDTDGGCLKARARVSVKEGLNDQTNPNDLFVGADVPATLLAADSSDSQNTKSAGGYEIDGQACTDASGPSSLLTKQKLDAVSNKVSTMVCLTQIPTSSTNLGLATTILEGVVHPGNPGLPQLETSDVCVAAPGVNCGPYGGYTPQVFDADHPMTIVLRIPDALLLKNQTITKVWHNADLYPDPLALCGTGPVPVNGCLVAKPSLSKGKDKIWTITVKTLTNGWFTGG
ncbi:MAG TPA: hypothetical protein VFM41_07420 [Gaiella sp.]|nr:hypothetical protein [Gaiella sp.]